MPVWKSGSVAGQSRHKSSQQSQSSIRGRISGPIPISGAGEDDEFPIRSPGSGIAIPASNDDEFPIRKPGSRTAASQPLPEEIQEPQELRSPEASHSAVSLSVGNVHSTQNTTGHTEPPSQPALEPQGGIRTVSGNNGNRASPQRGSPVPAPRTHATSAVRYSTLSEAPTTHSRNDTPSRKKSSLRAALGRLFGRKKKSSGSQGSSSTSGRASGTTSLTQHRSDPSALSRDRVSEPKRSTSLPITEYDRALRSHSVGPDDLIAVNSARNSTQQASDSGKFGHSRKRAVTASGRLLPPFSPSPTSRRGDGDWAGGLSPRPASTHGRGSRVDPGELDDPSEIGRAITSDSGGGFGMRRRSRSLSGLQDVLGAIRTSSEHETRRRSDEIRYWRESYDQGFLSPLSSKGPDDFEHGQDDVHDNNHERDRGQEQDSAASVPGNDNYGAAKPTLHETQQPSPDVPPQPFNFGSISKDMIGMKITQAASIDMRLGGLEARMVRLERVVEQLCHTVPGFRTPLSVANPTSSDPPSTAYTARGSDLGIVPGSSEAQPPDLSFEEAPTYVASIYPPSSSDTQIGSLAVTAPLAEPTHLADNRSSNSTVRGRTSLGHTKDADLLENERRGDTSAPTQSNLTQQLEAERIARQALEAQVAKLSQRLNTLSTTMYAMVRSKSQEHLRPPTPSSDKRINGPSPPIDRHHMGHAVTCDEYDDERQTEDEFLTPDGRSTLGYNPNARLGYGRFVDDEPEEYDEDDTSEVGDTGSAEDEAKRRQPGFCRPQPPTRAHHL